jgi:hypothetical protein
MHDLMIYLKARIEWCQHQGRTATNVHEKRSWWAEEAGLVDALRGRPSPSSSPESFGAHFARYQLGLEEGLAIMRLIEPCAGRQDTYEAHYENRPHNKSENKLDGPGHGRSAQPSGFLAST